MITGRAFNSINFFVNMMTPNKHLLTFRYVSIAEYGNVQRVKWFNRRTKGRHKLYYSKLEFDY